jgi:hypothetical protein
VAGYSHRTAQPPILAVFLPWGGSAGAGRVRPADAKVGKTDRFSYQFWIEFKLENPIIWSYLFPGTR